MERSSPEQVTRLLQRLSHGDALAADELMPLVYDELRGLAEQIMGPGRAGHTLQPTALVNEAFLRLAGSGEMSFTDHRHFIGVAAKAMRSVLIDHVRRKRAAKRGGAFARVPLDDIAAAIEERVPDLLSLDEALVRLAAVDPELARIVELRFFAGLSIEETARVVGSSETSIVRAWQVARMWLQREVGVRPG